MQVAFRVDASSSIGAGHLYRCLTLARACRTLGWTITFIVCDLPDMYLRLFEENGIREFDIAQKTHRRTSVPLDSTSKTVDAAQDSRLTIAALANSNCQPDWLVVDHYLLGHEWEHELRPVAKRILVIDDLADRRHDCDIILDQNLGSDTAGRYAGLVPKQTRRLLGLKYALLQPEYALYRQQRVLRLNESAAYPRIFIYFGATDRSSLIDKSLAAIERLNIDAIAVDVVLPTQCGLPNALLSRWSKKHWVKFHQVVPSLAGLMVGANIAIGAAGATTWERCCLGIPTLLVSLADHQVPIAKTIDQLGLGWWLGSEREVDSAAISAGLLKALGSSELRSISENCAKLVDGLGAQRVTEVMSKCFHSLEQPNGNIQ